ncbi:MAG: amino acid adenylation domain-containing protein [Candidatus Omnitrophota bacterium]
MTTNRISGKCEITAAQNIEEKNYWLKTLSGEWTKSRFPYDTNRVSTDSSRMETVDAPMPAELCTRLNALSGGADIRVFITLVTGLMVLLSKFTHQTDMTVGTTIYRQEGAGFLNTLLPLRNELDDRMAFKDALMKTGKILLEANKYRDYPMEKIIELLELETSDSDDFPLFDTAIVFEGLHDRNYLRDVRVNTIFSVKRTGDRFDVTVEYNTLRYRRATIDRILSHLMTLLQRAVSDVNASLGDIDPFPPEEKEKILFSFNDTQTDYRRDITMHRLFEEQVERTPDRIAVIDDHTRLTYRELKVKTDGLAWELRKRGLTPNAFTAVIMDRTADMVVAVLSILKAGGAYVPVEPYLPESRILACLSSANAHWVLTGLAQMSTIDAIRKEWPGIHHVICLDDWEGGDEPPALSEVATSEDIAYVIFTSGTTGTPKGVVVKHKPVINLIEWVNTSFNVGETDKVLFVVSLSFDLSVYDIFGILAGGGAVRVANSEDIRSPERLLQMIIDEDITFWDSAPAALQLLVPYLERLPESNEYLDKLKSSKLRLVFLSGDWIPLSISDTLKANFPGVQVIGLGGATEAVVWSNYYPIGEIDPDWLSIPYGRPIQNARYYILDRWLNPCPIGVAGDLYIGGECLASGYINDDALTASKFIANPFCPGENEKMYKTGDMAKWFPDGVMEFLGRQDNQVKIRGYRIELGEIESRLIKHAEIKEAVVVARGEAKGDRYLCAYYTGDRTFEPGELHAYLAGMLPPYMIPPYFIQLDQVPLTANGKVDRKRLPEPLLDGGGNYIAPGDPIEDELAGIFAQVLKLEKEHISVDANFFDLGGHSLTATYLAALIHEKMNTRVSLADIFKTPTVNELAHRVRNTAKVSFAAIEAVEEKEYYTASSAQKRLYFMQKREPNSPFYNIFGKLDLSETPDQETVAQTMAKLIERHRSLRTSFDMVDGRVVQRIHDQVDVQPDEIDPLSNDHFLLDLTQPFDLSRAPLLRAAVVREENDRRALWINMHHIITDGVSVKILLDEFAALNRGSRLTPLRIQYNDFAEWQDRFLKSEHLSRQLAFWGNVLSGEIPVLDMPLDFPRPSVQDFAADEYTFVIGPELRKGIRELETTGSTLFMILLAAFNILLMKYSGQEDILVGSPTAGRHHADLLGVVGMFVNLLALRNRPQHDQTFDAFLADVHTNCLQAFENQDTPFEDVVNRFVPKVSPARHPLFDVCFFLQNFSDKQNVNEKTGSSGEKKTNQTNQTHQSNQTKVTRSIQFDMELGAYETTESIYLFLSYSTALYKRSTIEKMAARYLQILEQVVNQPGMKLKDITVASQLLPLQSAIDLDEDGDFGL